MLVVVVVVVVYQDHDEVLYCYMSKAAIHEPSYRFTCAIARHDVAHGARELCLPSSTTSARSAGSEEQCKAFRLLDPLSYTDTPLALVILGHPTDLKPNTTIPRTAGRAPARDSGQ